MIRWLPFLLLIALPSSGQAQTSTWRGTPLAEAVLECQRLPNFETLLSYYYTALRADPGDEINLRALRDFSALAVRHGTAKQAAFLFERHVGHNQGQPAGSAVTKSLVNAFLSAEQRDQLISLILAPPTISPRSLAEIKFMTVVGLTERGEAWVAYELQRRNPGFFDDIDLNLAFYLGAVQAQNPVLIGRFEGSMQLIEIQAYRAGLESDFAAYFGYAALPESRRIRAVAAFAYGLTSRDLSPPFDQVVAPLSDIFDPALLANVFARTGRPSWAVSVLEAANTAPQFGGQVYADLALAEELVRLGSETALTQIHRDKYLDSAPGLAVSLMRSGQYSEARTVLAGLSNQEIAAINPLLVLAIIANGDGNALREEWSNTRMRARLFDNLLQFTSAFGADDRAFNNYLASVERNTALDGAEVDFTLNLLTNLLELEGRFDRAAQVVGRIKSPALRLRSANSLAQAISHRCFGGSQTVSPFYPFTLGDPNLDADYRQRILRVF